MYILQVSYAELTSGIKKVGNASNKLDKYASRMDGVAKRIKALSSNFAGNNSFKIRQGDEVLKVLE